ncbi:hypothetical protein D1007_61392 [Hordeum vulgare]|nr:hypothetical protein D1007_61392 [Hordeum vulgare]
MAVAKTTAELDSLKIESGGHKARVAEVQQELHDASAKNKALEQRFKEQVTELSKLSSMLKSERVQKRFFEEEVRRVKKIANAPDDNLLLGNQMKQPMDLHRMAEPAMKDLYIRLWPTEALSSSYFSLVLKLFNTMPHLDVLKRSICMEGAWMAFARTMTHWPGVKPLTMATALPPVGKEHRRLELYFAAVMEGARTIEDVTYE